MKKIRELIETKLANAKLDLANRHYSNKDGLIGNIEAYQDLLALIPKHRTEEEILKDFEKMGYEVRKTDKTLTFRKHEDEEIFIRIEYEFKRYSKYDAGLYEMPYEDISIQEHKLLNELFSLWGWI